MSSHATKKNKLLVKASADKSTIQAATAPTQESSFQTAKLMLGLQLVENNNINHDFMNMFGLPSLVNLNLYVSQLDALIKQMFVNARKADDKGLQQNIDTLAFNMQKRLYNFIDEARALHSIAVNQKNDLNAKIAEAQKINKKETAATVEKIPAKRGRKPKVKVDPSSAA